MSVTTGGDQGQGNGNRNANQITQSSQEVVVNTGGVTTGGGANLNAQANNQVTVGGQAVARLQNANPHQLLLWNGNWPGAT